MAGNIKVGSAGSSGTTTLQSTETADRTVSLPNATDTLVGLATTDTLTNKVITTQAGTATVAPLTVTHGTNLTNAAIDTFENDGAAFYNTVDVTGGRRINDSWQLFRLTGNGSGITTIADFFGTNDGIPLVASGVYEIEWHAYFTLATSTGTATWTIVNTGTITNQVANWIATPIAGIGTQGATTSAAVITNTSTSAALPASGTLSIASHYHKITLMLEQNGAGNTRLRLAMSAGTATPLRDSYFKVRRLSAGNTGTFVA